MPRTARVCLGGYTYHVLNRGNARAEVFHKPDDYDVFIDWMAEASVRKPMRILAYCLMPNHFHLALWPREDGDPSRWMRWLMTAHVRRSLRHYHSSGHVWQGRFKAFPAQEDEHLPRSPGKSNEIRSERSGRAGRGLEMVELARAGAPGKSLDPTGAVPRGEEWLAGVNAATPQAEVECVREAGRISRHVTVVDQPDSRGDPRDILVNPVRPDRVDPRVIKRRMKRYPLMKEPRPVLRKRLLEKKVMA